MFDKVLEAYQLGDKNLFEARVRNWMDANQDNPFAPNTTEHELFFKAHLGHKRWRSGAISGRSGRKEMIHYAEEIMKIYIEKAEKEKEVNNKTAVKPVVVQEAIVDAEPKETETVKLDTPEHVLGIVPEVKSKSFLKRRKE